MPRLAWIASVVAFLMAALVILSALTGAILALPFALIPLMAGVGILRRRCWSAYGFGLFLSAQVLLLLLLVFRAGEISGSAIAGAALALVLAVLFFLAGRALAAAGSKRGQALPWVVVAALFTLPLLFVQVFVIRAGSMEKTLLIGDHILVQRFPRPTPVRGGMAVIRDPADRRQTYVKRVIGIPGDRIRIARKVVYRNGTVLQEPYAVHITEYMDSYRDNFPSEPQGPYANAALEMLSSHVVNGEVLVPEGKYFVLGDNRDNSLDSRYWGFIDSRDVIGKPLLIYHSEEQDTEGVAGGPRRVRWNRILKLL